MDWSKYVLRAVVGGLKKKTCTGLLVGVNGLTVAVLVITTVLPVGNPGRLLMVAPAGMSGPLTCMPSARPPLLGTVGPGPVMVYVACQFPGVPEVAIVPRRLVALS